MTCSTCHQLGHSKKSCPVTKGGSGRGSGQSSSAQKRPIGSGESSSAQKRPTGSGQSSSTQKRPKNAGLGCYINPTTGRTAINPGSSSERVVRHGTMRDTSAVNIDFGFKPPGLKFKGKSAVTTTQLQQQSRNRRNITTNKPSTQSEAKKKPIWKS